MKAYQLKIQIKNSHPPIWRRLIVPAGLSFSQLSVVLNETMGWCGYHLSSFEFYHLRVRIEEEIADMDDFGWYDFRMEDASETLIDTYLDTEEWFTYVYDFGDDWQHRVTVEKVLQDYGENYAQVLKYKGETPYEDCGGIDEYYELLEILKNPKHPQYKERKMWVDQHFWMEYDLGEVNQKLQICYLSKKESAPMSQREIYRELLEENEPFKQINLSLANLSFAHDKIETDAVEWQTVTLKDIFDTYTKDELKEIAAIHELHGYSKLKKEQMIQHLCKDLLTPDVMQRYFCYISDLEVELLEGKENFRETNYVVRDYSTLPAGGYAAFKYDFEEEYICVPKEVQEAYRRNCSEEWKQLRKPARELAKYLNMAAELYGICPVEKALEVYKKLTGKEKTAFEILQFAREIPENKKVYVIKNGKIVMKMLEMEGIAEEAKIVQTDLDYYIPTQEEAESFMENGCFPFNRAMRKLQMFFCKNGDETEEDAEDICRHIQFILRVGGLPEAILEMLEEYYLGFEEMMEDEQMLDTFTNHLMEVLTTTRLMPLRGHTPEEVYAPKKPKKSGKIIRFPGGIRD